MVRVPASWFEAAAAASQRGERCWRGWRLRRGLCDVGVTSSPTLIDVEGLPCRRIHSKHQNVCATRHNSRPWKPRDRYRRFSFLQFDGKPLFESHLDLTHVMKVFERIASQRQEARFVPVF
jgi:hypothetical protein